MNPNPRHIIATKKRDGDRATSIYSEIYLDDDYCEYAKQKEHETNLAAPEIPEKERPTGDKWRSPSDVMLEDWVDLKPPFTSRITRGTAHEGVLKIGQGVIKAEQNKFFQYIDSLVKESDIAWAHIQEQEKFLVARKVKNIYEKIFLSKSKTMQTELSKFFEESLQEMEDVLKQEVKNLLISTQSKLISQLNNDIQEKLKKEKSTLEKILRIRYNSEIKKINHYYELLLANEKYRNGKLINQSICHRNDAVKAFSRIIDAENNTTTMYVMCTERNKCKIKKMYLEKYYDKEIAAKLKKIKERQDVLDELIRKKKTISEINTEWEEKVKKILQLFLKFISFSLKLLPEQTVFLLDLERLVVLQLNEIKKNPGLAPSILVPEEDIYNLFEFDKVSTEESLCETGPFLIEGDLASSVPTEYGSRESLPSNVDLPMFRLQRQFIYAKCEKYEDVRKMLDEKRCKCRDSEFYGISGATTGASSPVRKQSTTDSLPISTSRSSKESSLESYVMPDLRRVSDCPLRGCQDFSQLSFPNLADYEHYDDAKYARVMAILGVKREVEPTVELIRGKDIALDDVPFAAPKKAPTDVGTQYSSQEDLKYVNANGECKCIENIAEAIKPKYGTTANTLPEVAKVQLTQRRQSFERLFHGQPQLLDLFFSDEKYNYKLEPSTRH